MNIRDNLEILYNLKYIVCLPKYSKSFESLFNYCFSNVFLFEENLEDVEIFLNIINQNNIKNIILVDFLPEYAKIIDDLKSEVKFSVIFTSNLSDKSNKIINFYNKKSIKEINILDNKLYRILKNDNFNVNLFKFNKLNYKLNNLKKYFKIKKKEKLLLTIVVPVYNVEKYLSECLESICAAKVDDMEIIVINDGSTDNSEKIIQQYCKKHPSLIRYIKQENKGLGNVRNVGVMEAKGKYIASIDADDSININFFKEALPYLQKNIDVVVYDWMYILNNGEKNDTVACDYIFNKINKYKGLLYTTIMPSACNKIIKKSLIKSLNYKYAEGLKYEDLSLTPLVLMKAEKIKYINKSYYEYKILDASIMRSKNSFNMIDIIVMLDNRINNIIKDDIRIDLEEFKYYTYFWRIEEFVFNLLYKLELDERNLLIDYINEKLVNILKELYNNKYYLERLDRFDDNTKHYIKKRNNAIFNNDLKKFIVDVKDKNDFVILSPAMILYE